MTDRLAAFLLRLPREELGFAVLVGSALVLVVLALFFAANVFLLRLRNARRDAIMEAREARWEPLILDGLADPSRMDRVHVEVAPEEELHFVGFVQDYARRLRGEERELLEQVAAPYLGAVVDQLGSARVERRARAVQTLGELGLPRHARAVRDALSDRSPLVTMVAARALARHGDAGYVEPVLQALHHLRGWRRETLAAMLAEMGPGAAPALRAALDADDRRPWVRAVAADALADLNDLSSAEVAARVVETAADRELLAAALRLLGEVGRTEHVGLVRVRAASPDFAVRSQAFAVLGALGEEGDVTSIRTALGDPSPWVAIHAARALLRVGERETLERLAGSEHPRAPLAAQVLEEAGSGPALAGGGA